MLCLEGRALMTFAVKLRTVKPSEDPLRDAHIFGSVVITLSFFNIRFCRHLPGIGVEIKGISYSERAIQTK